MQFIAELRRLSGGKPVGFKMCVGHPWEFLAICKAILETNIVPDFIVIDGAEGGTGERQAHAARADQADHIARARAERHADADFVGALRHRVRDHAVDAERGEDQRERGEEGQQQRQEARAGTGGRWSRRNGAARYERVVVLAGTGEPYTVSSLHSVYFRRPRKSSNFLRRSAPATFRAAADVHPSELCGNRR